MSSIDGSRRPSQRTEIALSAATAASLREAGNTNATTLATMSRMTLATDVLDPLARLHAIPAGSDRTKSLTRETRRRAGRTP